MEFKYSTIIQKIFRGFYLRQNNIIQSSYYQTKHWRQTRLWYNGGKSNECENYQKSCIYHITKQELIKTDKRFNISNNELIENKNPMKNNDGYEYTENFDGAFEFNKNTYLFNLKFCCDDGGSQTRTMRIVYYFIKLQLEYLLMKDSHKYKTSLFFINILDGDTSYKNQDKFLYLINKNKYELIKKNVFIGDMKMFQDYWKDEQWLPLKIPQKRPFHQ